MAGQFDFISPGAAFGDAITQALVERKAAQRQNLLDTLGVKAEQRADQEAQQMKQVRDQQIASGKQRDEMEHVDAITRNLDHGANLDTLGYSPDDIKTLQRYGRVATTQMPASPPFFGSDGVNGSQDGIAAQPPQMQHTYIGTPQQQDEAKMKAGTAQMIAAMPAGENKNALIQATAINGGKLPPEFYSMIMPAKHVMEWDKPSNKFKDTGQTAPWNSEVVTRDYAPAQYFNQQDTIAGWSPTGPKGLHGEPGAPAPDGLMYPVMTSKKHGGLEIQATPISPTGAAVASLKGDTSIVKYNPKAVNDHGQAVANLQLQPNEKTASWAKQTALNIITSSNASERVKTLARLRIQDPAQSVVVMGQLTDLSQHDKDALDDLLGAAWPKELATSYGAVMTPKKTQGMPWLRSILGMPNSTQDQQ